MPVNLPTHAHGQGYTDLNFLIPELVSDLHFKKGPYYADEGDFATAGAVRMDLLDEVPRLGKPGSERTATAADCCWDPPDWRRHAARGADLYHNDGPFDQPDDYQRLNGVLRYSPGTVTDFFTVTAMAYSGRWNSTDQVPEHAVTDGAHRPLRQPRPVRRRRDPAAPACPSTAHGAAIRARCSSLPMSSAISSTCGRRSPIT